MEKTSNRAPQKVHQHREDGEEAAKQTGKIVPIDSARGQESAEGNANATPGSDKPQEEKRN